MLVLFLGCIVVKSQALQDEFSKYQVTLDQHKNQNFWVNKEFYFK